MQDLFNFILAYWKPLFGILCIIVSIVILCVKKKPINSILGDIFGLCLAAVSVAESSGLKGVDKLNRAIEYVNAALLHDYPNLNVDQYRVLITKVIESILDTPQKKGE